MQQINFQQENHFQQSYKIYLKPHMNFFQNFHFKQNHQTFHSQNAEETESQQSRTQIHNGNSIIFQSEQKPHVVEGRLEEKNTRSLWRNSLSKFEEEESDIQDCVEEVAQEVEECVNSDDDQKEEEHECSYYNGSIMPQYLTMPRFQRQNYFERLNKEYMRKLNTQTSQNLNSNSDTSLTQTLKKPAIKFSSVVYEVPFGKQDQPINVRYALQEETYLMVNGQIQEQPTIQESEDQIQIQQHNLIQENDYFDEFHALDFDQKIDEENLSDISKTKAQSEENIKEDTDIFQSNLELTLVSPKDIEEPIEMEDLFFQEEEANSFKRDANGKYLSQTSSSDQHSNDSSSQWKEINYNEEFESYFALFLQGRKINPNTLHSETTADEC